MLFKEYVDPKKLDRFAEVKKFHYPELVLRVSHDKLSAVASDILKNFSVDDVTIEDPPIEDVIREVFIKNGNK